MTDTVLILVYKMQFKAVINTGQERMLPWLVHVDASPGDYFIYYKGQQNR